MLTKRFYFGVFLYSFLCLILIFCIALCFEKEHNQGNGYRLAILQTIITLCTLTSTFTAVTEEGKRTLRDKIYHKFELYAITKVGDKFRDEIRNDVASEISETVSAITIRIMKIAIILSIVSILTSIIIIHRDCTDCRLYYLSWVLFLPIIFICVSYFKFKIVKQKNINKIIKYDISPKLKNKINLYTLNSQSILETEIGKLENEIENLQQT